MIFALRSLYLSLNRLLRDRHLNTLSSNALEFPLPRTEKGQKSLNEQVFNLQKLLSLAQSPNIYSRSMKKNQVSVSELLQSSPKLTNSYGSKPHDRLRTSAKQSVRLSNIDFPGIQTP